MKHRFSYKTALLFHLALFFFTLINPKLTPVFGQNATAGSFKPKQQVQVEYIPDSGKWFPATIIEVLNDGYSYKVSVAPWGDGKVIQTNIHYKRVRAIVATLAPKNNTKKATGENTRPQLPALGKYGCTLVQYNAATKSYEFIAKGSFELAANKTYRYNGFSKPSAGQYHFDAKSGALNFTGGYFDKGKATPVPGTKNRYLLVTPTLAGGRWTCSFLGKK